jgi:hypothetical protein
VGSSHLYVRIVLGGAHVVVHAAGAGSWEGPGYVFASRVCHLFGITAHIVIFLTWQYMGLCSECGMHVV